VRIGADRVKITLFLRGAERVHVPTVTYNIPYGNVKDLGTFWVIWGQKMALPKLIRS